MRLARKLTTARRIGSHSARAGVSRASFDPRSISGLQLWLDAADASTFTLSGSNVSQWNDKSGNARHVLQATSANQPTKTTLGGKPVVSFDGVNDFLRTAAASSTISQPYTVALVASAHTYPSGYASLLTSWNSPPNVQVWFKHPSALAPGGYAGNFLTGSAPPSADAATQLTMVFNGASSGVWLNGTSVASGNPGSSGVTLATIGAWSAGGQNSFLDGTVHELVFYNSALSTGNRQAVEAYLKSKWGTP